MAIRDLAGTAVLQEALTTTNALLAAVLDELRETNGQRLEQVAVELRELSSKVDRLADAQQGP